MKAFFTWLTVFLLLTVALFCGCGGSEDPVTPPSTDEKVTTATLDILPKLSNFKIIYPEENEAVREAAIYLSETFEVKAKVSVPVIPDSEYTASDKYIITVGDVELGEEFGRDQQKVVRRESNSSYGAFAITFDNYHIYLLADDDTSVKAGIEYFSDVYVSKKEIVIPGQQEDDIIHYYSKDRYPIYGAEASVVERSYLESLTTLATVTPKRGEDCLRVESDRNGNFTVVTAAGSGRPPITAEASSPLATCKVGIYNTETKKTTITITNGDKTATYYVSFKQINPTYMTTLSDEALSDAMSVGLIKFINGKENYTWEMEGATALITLALHEHDYPGSYVDGTSVAKRILAHIRNTLKNNQEPGMRVGPYWANPLFACSLALAKETSTVWNELTDKEVEKLDWIMQCYAVIVNYASNSQNNFLTGPELNGNFNKGWNPNFRSSNLVQILACVSYFGSASAVNEILTSFSYDTYISKLQSLSLNNIVANWTVANSSERAGFSKELFEQGMGTENAPFTYGNGSSGGYGVGVKIPFTYTGDNATNVPLEDVETIFNSLIYNLYSRPVDSTVGEAYIEGRINSPYEKQLGMMAEYNSGDAKGVRSDAEYCTHNFSIMAPSTAALIALGLWDPTSSTNKALFSRIWVGNEDHIFKMTKGYYSFSHGTLSTTPSIEDTTKVTVYGMTKHIWRDYLINFIVAED